VSRTCHVLATIICVFGSLIVAANEVDVPTGSGRTCHTLPHEIELDSEFGSVGFMKNVAEHPESIRAIASRLLSQAVQSREFKEIPKCELICSSIPYSNIVYRVQPTMFLPEQRQQALCLSSEERTKLKPLRFDKKEFNSVEKLNDWIMDLSQGRGADGKLLYELCGGNCSPRYKFHIAKHMDKLFVDTEILCGLARDKKSDQYAVSTSIRWQCSDN